MAKIYSDITELIGGTPLVRLSRFAPGMSVLAKLERQASSRTPQTPARTTRPPAPRSGATLTATSPPSSRASAPAAP